MQFLPLLDEGLSWKLDSWSLNHVNWILTCLFLNCHNPSEPLIYYVSTFKGKGS